jgi:hypothetical protein
VSDSEFFREEAEMTDQNDEARFEQDEDDVEGHRALKGRVLRGGIDENESNDDVEGHMRLNQAKL